MAKQRLNMQKLPYREIPLVPTDFDGAVAVHAEALKAVEYWKDLKKFQSWTPEYNLAHTMLPRWQQVKDSAQTVIQSFQMRLF